MRGAVQHGPGGAIPPSHLVRDLVALTAQLRAFLPPQSLLTQDEELRPFECDGLTVFRERPRMVALPDSEDQVKTILALCHAAQVPVVTRGAGTGLSGGATPHREGLLLGLSKLNRIISLDPLARTARVQPGVRNLAISEAARAHGLYYAPDPSSQIACSIGGNVAENAGGVHCLKYGLTLHNILRLRVVTIEGELLEIGSEALDSAGLDLLALMTGSEGMLGVITEVTVKLLPRPETARVILAGFADSEQAAMAVAAIIAAGIVPAGLEMMDQAAVLAVEQFAHAGYPLDAGAVLLCESDGAMDEVADEIERMRSVITACGATTLIVSVDETERLRLWKGRKSAFPAAGRVAPDYYCMDGTIPRKHLARVLQQIAALSERYSLACANVFHAGDGNLHPLILFDASKSGELERAQDFGAAILELCIEVGGTITGEHGVGLEKIDAMCVQFGRGELERFHGIKHAFDPQSLLNPGKAVPTLHRCAEMGAMRVHQGQLPHPELPRF
jgi:glycolate oxidase